ncbi:MAG: TRAP transporter small permease [Clostridia bacterium]|nr:TRAP transporter small permease [Clostridia bacterium]
MRKFARIYDKVTEGFLTLLFVMAFLVVMAQAVSRYVFNAPIIWTDEVSTLFQMLLAFLGLSYGIRKRSHIKVDGLYKKLPETVKQILTLAFAVLMIVICVQMIALSIQYCTRNWNIRFGTFALGKGKAFSAVPIGLSLTALYSLMDGIDAVMRLTGKKAVFNLGGEEK